LDVSSLFVLAIAFGYIFKDKIGILSMNYIMLIFVIFLFCGLLFMSRKASKFAFMILYNKFIPKSFRKRSRVAFDSLYRHFPQKKYIMLAFFVNIINWVITYMVAYSVGQSLGIGLSFVYYLAIMPLATLIAQIPITINGLGTRELTMIGLFGLFGVEATKVFSMSVLSLLISGVLPSIIGIILILRENKLQTLKK